MNDLETNPDFLAHMRMCLDLGLDPENSRLEWVEPIDTMAIESPWLKAWQDKQYDSDIDMNDRSRFNPKIKGLPQIEVNNIIR